MKYFYLEQLIWEHGFGESNSLQVGIDAFLLQFPFLFMWKDTLEWTLRDNNIHMETRVEGHKTLLFLEKEVPFYYGMMVKEVSDMIAFFYPGKILTYRLYYHAWYEPNDEFVSLPFSSKRIELDIHEENIVVSIS